MDSATLKENSSRTKDKIGSSFYVATGKQQTRPFSTCIYRILISQKTAMDKHQPVTFCM